MKTHLQSAVLAAVLVIFLFTPGCASLDQNPRSARPGRGYVDLYTDPKVGVWWKVDVYDSRGNAYRQYTAELKAPALGILRLEAKPGRYQARISFVNAAVEAPAEVEVEVSEGAVTPIRVTGEAGGESFVRMAEDRLRWERSRTTDYAQTVWRITATTQAPVPYAPKESIAYWKQ